MTTEGIIRRTAALARGVTDDEIRQLVRSGRWMRLASGVYMPSEEFASADDCRRHAFRARAVMANASPEAALSHVSAAVVHGLEVWGIPLDDVHLTRNRRNGARRSPGRVMHSARICETDIVVKDGVRVLDVARTVVDLAATAPFENAVVLGDHALRRGLTTTDDVMRAADRMGTHPGHAKVRRALRFMSDRSDSVGESRSRVLIVREQLPIPETQADIFDEAGRWLARVDFLFPDHGVIGEFDGRIKYRRDGVASADAEDVVYQEKLREDRVRHAGFVVVRWTWADLQTPGVVAAKIRDAIALASRGSGPTGSFLIRKLTR